MVVPGLRFFVSDAAGLHEVYYRAKAAAFRAD